MSENFLKKFFETKKGKEPETDQSVQKNLNEFTERLEGIEEKQTETSKKNNGGSNESDDEKIEDYRELNLDRPEE